MTNALKVALKGVVEPLLRRPKRLQVAALCYRNEKAGKEVLLITSRDSKRWIVPKGWPIDGLDAPGAAMQEAWEEAGVAEGNINRKPLGSYDYSKGLDNGASVPVETTVFAVEVDKIADEFPESNERERHWFDPERAAELVDEPGLQKILRQL